MKGKKDPNLTAQYEAIGNRAARHLREMEEQPPGVVGWKLMRTMREFVKKYEEVPLFVIGLDAAAMADVTKEWRDGDLSLIFSNFKLPYPALVLDFPKGMNPKRPEDPCVVFIDTLEENRYYIEVLRTDENYKDRVAQAPPHEQELAQLMPMDSGQTIGEAVAIVLQVDPVNPSNTKLKFSCEYIFDCQVPVEPDESVRGYCVFSSCTTKPGKCLIKTPICRNVNQSADFILTMLVVVFSYINRPDRYVVKVTPEKTEREKRYASKGRIPSFSKKEVHIVLDHAQIREIVAAAAGGSTHNSPLPHHRRGHWRQLQSDRYKEQKTVWVRPADINKGMKIELKKSVYEVVS